MGLPGASCAKGPRFGGSAIPFGVPPGFAEVHLGRGRRPGRELKGDGETTPLPSCAPSPELKRPELRIHKGRTRPPALHLPQNRRLGSLGPSPSWGSGLRMLLLVLLKVTRRELTSPTSALTSSLRFLSFLKSFSLPQYLTWPCPPRAQQALPSPTPLPSSFFGPIIYIKKSLWRASSLCLRVWGGGGAWLGPRTYHSGEN